MKVKPGIVCFAAVGKALGGPRWRQALVLRRIDAQVALLVVRLDSEAAHSDAVFKISGKSYTIVEGESSTLKARCSHAFLALEVEAADVLAEGEKFMAENQELVFTTASEDVATPGKPAAMVDKGSSESERSSDESAMGPDELLAQITKIQKQWQGKGMSEDEKPDKSKRASAAGRASRYALLARRETDREMKTSKGHRERLGRAASSSEADPLQALGALELLKRLGATSKRRSKESSSSASADGTSDSSSSDRRKGKRSTGVARAMGDYRRLKKDMRRHPMRHVRRYVKQVEEDLGVSAELPYRLTDHGKKIPWGKQKGLQRVYYLLGAILEQQLKGNVEQAALLTTQSLRAVHQTVLDGGNWSVAWMLTGLQDPFVKRKFGGEEESLETIAAYMRASQELERRARAWSLHPDSSVPPENEEPEPKGPVKGRGRGGKQQETQKSET